MGWTVGKVEKGSGCSTAITEGAEPGTVGDETGEALGNGV